MSSLTTISEQLVEAVAAAGRFVVSIDVGRRFPASGVLWSADTIVTAEHSVKRDDDLKVTLPDGRAVNATLAPEKVAEAILECFAGWVPAPASEQPDAVGSTA